MKVVFILVGIAFALEMFGPLILSKVFPQSLASPAPDVPVRPQRTGARNDSYVDDALGNLAGVQSSTISPRSLSDRASLVSSSSSAALATTPTPDSFDYDEFRRENESVMAPAVPSEPVQLSQGVPDMFDESVTGIHA